MRKKIGILGSRGFVGSGVVLAIANSGAQALDLPRLQIPDGVRATDDLATVVGEIADVVVDQNVELLSALSGVECVVNAAGLASPTEPDYELLWQTNTLLPAVLDHLCAHAGVERVVHVSSAAVQSDMSPLTEKAEWRAHSPYAESKKLAETYLLEQAQTPTVIYRATSVIGPNRAIVERLLRLYRGRIAPIFGDGLAPLPLSALPNTCAALAALAQNDRVGIVLQPWEGVTQQALADSLAGDRTRLVRLPITGLYSTVRKVTDRLPGPVVAQLRRVDLLVFGQAQEATALVSDGYKPVVNTVDYLAELTRPAS